MNHCPLLAAGIALIASTSTAQVPAEPTARPNILLVMADDMGFSDIGCYGARRIRTPNIDRLASDGLRFTAFYNNAKCTTTRASLLTGRYPRNGGRGIDGLFDRSALTLGEAMRVAGYRTSLSGKWHNGSKPGLRPFDRGFDEAYGLWDGCSNFFDPSRPDPEFKGGRTRVFGHNDQVIDEFPDGFFTTDAFADHAASTIRRFVEEGQADGKPFFAYLPFTAPHYPLHALPEDIASYRSVFDDGWDVLQKERHARGIELGTIDGSWQLPPPDPEVEPWGEAPDKEWQVRRMETYAAMVTHLDRALGRVLDTLDVLGVAENTLVLFLSDNGSCAETPGGNDPNQVPGPAEFYSHVGPGWAYAQNSPYRRYKSRMHEGGIATPLIARWPAAIKPGTLTGEVGHIIDFLPTFLDLAGTPYPTSYEGHEIQPVEGKSLAPVFRGGTREPHEAIFWFFNGARAVRQGDWKLVWDPREKRWELYELGKDRTEMRNLVEEEPGIAKALREKWEAWADMTDVRYE